jgi:hypothetical protein
LTDFAWLRTEAICHYCQNCLRDLSVWQYLGPVK